MRTALATAISLLAIVAISAAASASQDAARRAFSPPAPQVVQDAASAGVTRRDLRRTVLAPVTATPPVIDGRLDDEAWQSAAAFDDFTQVDPIEGAPPSERTLVLVMRDAEALYIGVRCYDSEPDRIVATQMQRDGNLGADDRISIAVDSYSSWRTGFLFELSAAGGKRDALIESARTTRVDWDGVWLARTSIDELGWTAEIAIPFRSLSFDPDATTWGFNIERIIRRHNELVRWSTPLRNSSVQALGDAGGIAGITDIQQGLGLTVRPIVATRFDLERGSTSLEPGLDVFYKPTPSITVALTLNTDFADAEVDQRRVNLTRFPLFFPEKREFFLQDAQVFGFGGIFSSPLPFFSRRIGIVDGQEKGILAGAKVTGRAGGVAFGLLNVQMDDDDTLGDKNLTVARALFDIFEQSTLGVIVTHGDPGRPGDNTLIGGDFNFRDNDFLDGNALEAHAWVMATRTSGDDNDDFITVGGRISYPNEPVSFSIFAARIGEEFNPALGFVQRQGVYEYNASARYRWRPTSGVRRIDISTDINLFTSLSGVTQTSELTLPQLEVENHAGDTFLGGVIIARDNLERDFEISPGVIVPVGDYRFNRYFARASTSTARPLSGALRIETGDFLSGRRTDYAAILEWRPSPHFFAAAEYELNDVHLDEGSFDVHIARLSVNFLFSPELTWNNLVQYDNVSDLIGINSRLRWELEPGREIFLVLNQGFNADDRFATVTSDLTFKVGWAMRF